jgi:RNA polymerase sigma factor (sigma-70 family)
MPAAAEEAIVDRMARVDTRSCKQPDTLVERAMRGDQSAWDQLVCQHSPMMWRVARGHRLSREDAADVVQMTWLRLAEHIVRTRDPIRISSWLMTTVRRECIRLCRRRRATMCLDDAGPSAEEREQPDAVVESTDEQRLLLVAFNRLPARHRLLLGALIASPSSSYADIARELGVPLGSIGPTRQRALARLRREIATQLTGTAGPHPSAISTSQ